MVESRGLQWFLKGATALTLAFIYLPLVVIGLYAFNESRTNNWPIEGLSLQWFEKAVNNSGVRDALWTSVKAALGATAIAVLLGTLAAIAVSRYRFFGRETISFLVILPIALPGIVTGIALNTTFSDTRGRSRPLDDHHRARDVLHRRRLQQRSRAYAADRPGRSTRRRWISARTRGRRSAT